MSSNQYTVNIVNADELYIGGRKIQGLELGTLVVNDDAYGVGIGTDKPRLKLDISGNSGIRIPVGISTVRPNNATIGSDATNLLGVLRYNTTTEKYEAVYDHESTSVDPSWCNFVIETGTYPNNKVGINTGPTIPSHTLDVNGQIGINDYIIHKGDTDTKIGFPGANTFTITTNNYERMRVDSNGNMGIANQSPNYKLDVNGTIGIDGFIERNKTSSNSKFGFAPSYSTVDRNKFQILIDGNNNTDAQNFIEMTTEGTYFSGTGGGNVGIGTQPTSSYKLDVNGSIRFANTLKNSSGSMNIDSSSYIYFKSGGNIKMTMTPNGNLGIGLTSPGYPLDVTGAIRATSFLGNGASLTFLNASKITTGTINSGRLPITTTPQTTGTNGLTSIASRTYAVQHNSSNQLVVNVPWTNTTYGVGDNALTQKNFTSTLKDKLSGIQSYANYFTYTLPKASSSVKGGIIVGTNLSINSSGVLSSTQASRNTLGLSSTSAVKFGSLLIDQDITNIVSKDMVLRSYGKLYIKTGNNTSNGWSTKMTIDGAGYLGIATTTPRYPLHIAANRNSYYGGGIGDRNYTPAGWAARTGTHDWSAYAGRNVSAYTFSALFGGSIAILGTYIVLASDKRIKENITEVPDNLSLQKLRDISCCYYEYKDKFSRGGEKVFGFIAQQVREHMPRAVTLIKNTIPNEMRVINPQWTTLTDSSGNKYKLTIPDLQDISSTKYKFYVTNDPSDNDVEKEIFSMENDPKSFIFEEQWQNVFLYGKEIDDFHTLNKQALFTLNFSATQEIDKVQQAEKTKLEAAEAEINTLKTKNQDLETKLTNLIAQLKANNTI